jgi:16S rRNA processing protein RimM
MDARVCVGAVVGAHGVRGQVRVKSFTADPADVAAYGPVQSEDGTKTYKLKVTGEAKGLVLVKLEGVNDRNAAEAMRGTRFFVARERLPELEEDEFLYTDLVGLKAEDEEGAVLGTVKGVADFGAGELLDIVLSEGGSLMVPFTKAAVPVVDIANKRLVVIPPVFVEGDGASEAPHSGQKIQGQGGDDGE